MAKSWITEVARRVREPLSAYGFTARGRRFHRLAGSGDIAVIELRKQIVLDDGRECFRVHFGLVPGPWWDFIRGGVEGTTLDEIGRPRPEAGIWSDWLKVPPDQPTGRPPDYGVPGTLWVVRDADSAAWAARRLIEGLEESVLPDLIRYSADRQAVLDELAGPLRDILEIAFAAEVGEGGELESLLGRHLAALTGDRAGQRRSLGLARWARDYATRKHPSPAATTLPGMTLIVPEHHGGALPLT